MRTKDFVGSKTHCWWTPITARRIRSSRTITMRPGARRSRPNIVPSPINSANARRSPRVAVLREEPDFVAVAPRAVIVAILIALARRTPGPPGSTARRVATSTGTIPNRLGTAWLRAWPSGRGSNGAPARRPGVARAGDLVDAETHIHRARADSWRILRRDRIRMGPSASLGGKCPRGGRLPAEAGGHSAGAGWADLGGTRGGLPAFSDRTLDAMACLEHWLAESPDNVRALELRAEPSWWAAESSGARTISAACSNSIPHGRALHLTRRAPRSRRLQRSYPAPRATLEDPTRRPGNPGAVGPLPEHAGSQGGSRRTLEDVLARHPDHAMRSARWVSSLSPRINRPPPRRTCGRPSRDCRTTTRRTGCCTNRCGSRGSRTPRPS